MASNHHITQADNVLRGAAVFEPHKSRYDGRRGFLVSHSVFVSYGAAAAIVAGALIAAATSTELPNTATKTYTPATSGTSPLDSASIPVPATVTDTNGVARLCWPLDVARNVTLAVTHASSIVALSVKIYGLDEYRQPMTETQSVTATGTSKTAAGKKAFKWIYQYDIVAAADATADTVNLAWGNVFGLPYRVDQAERVVPIGNAIVDVSGTVTKADDSAAGATTGDVRGTWAPASAADGTKKFAAIVYPTDPQTAAGLFGVAQA